MLVLVLIVLELLWGRASLVVFAVFFNTGMPSTTGVVDAVFNPQNWEFVAVYLVVGAVFASIVYAMAVVSIPMILDRDTDAISAAITSIQVVFENTGVMILWGLVLTAHGGRGADSLGPGPAAGGALAGACQLACLPRRDPVAGRPGAGLSTAGPPTVA
jgi:hypothetical protein